MGLDDQFGLFGALLLFFAPARDQYGRFRVLCSKWKSRNSGSFRDVWTAAGNTHETNRNSFNFIDSITMALGAVCLGLSYWL